MAMITDTNIAMTRTESGFAARLTAFFQAIRAGQAAAIDYQRLQNRTDVELARSGLTRPDVIETIRARHFN